MTERHSLTLKSRVKPWGIQNFLHFDSMDRTLKCDNSYESCLTVLYCGAVCFFKFTQFVIEEHLSILDLALSRVKGLRP